MTGNATLAVSRKPQLLVTWTSKHGSLLPPKLAIQRLEGRNHNGMTYDLPLAVILHHPPQYHFGYPDQYVLMWHRTTQGSKQEEKTSMEAIFEDDYHSRLQGFNCKCLNIRRHVVLGIAIVWKLLRSSRTAFWSLGEFLGEGFWDSWRTL